MSHFSPPLRLEPHFSKRLAGILALLHSGTLLLLLPLRLSLAIKLILALCVLFSAIQTTCRHLFFINHPLHGCTLRDDSVELPTKQRADILPSTYIHPQLVVLRVRLAENHNKAYFLILFSDALDKQTFRRLRVYLRHANARKVKCEM
jgi:toxin CptA